MIPELTLAVVGIDFPNADGSNRRSEAMMTLPGEPVALIPEPRNQHDSNAIAVVSPRGVQIGYLFGGIIGVEKIFNYNGMGQLMLFAAQRKDIPMLQAGAIAVVGFGGFR